MEEETAVEMVSARFGCLRAAATPQPMIHFGIVSNTSSLLPNLRFLQSSFHMCCYFCLRKAATPDRIVAQFVLVIVLLFFSRTVLLFLDHSKKLQHLISSSFWWVTVVLVRPLSSSVT